MMLVLVNDEEDIKKIDHRKLAVRDMSPTSEYVIK